MHRSLRPSGSAQREAVDIGAIERRHVDRRRVVRSTRPSAAGAQPSAASGLNQVLGEACLRSSATRPRGTALPRGRVCRSRAVSCAIIHETPAVRAAHRPESLRSAGISAIRRRASAHRPWPDASGSMPRRCSAPVRLRSFRPSRRFSREHQRHCGLRCDRAGKPTQRHLRRQKSGEHRIEPAGM